MRIKMFKRGWEAILKCLPKVVCVNIFILWYGLVHCWNGYLAMLVGFLMVITWWRNQSAKVEEKLLLQVKNNFVQVLN